MAEQRLPAINGDDGAWGNILNQFIIKEHYDSGIDDILNGGHKNITIRPGTTDGGTAPLKFSSGPVMFTPEAGAIEFLTDRLYFTQTTGLIRKTIAAYDDTSGAKGDTYYRNVDGNFSKLTVGTTGQAMVVADGLPTWTTIFSGTTRISVGTTMPVAPAVGDLWIDSN